MQQECKASIRLLNEYINNLCALYSLHHQDCFLIGFSQGAMMAFEFGKYIDKIIAGCVLLSGRILPSENYEIKYFLKTPIMIVHGELDNVLESKYFFEACGILENQGFLFEKHLMKGEGHTISSKTLNLTQYFIKKNL